MAPQFQSAFRQHNQSYHSVRQTDPKSPGIVHTSQVSITDTDSYQARDGHSYPDIHRENVGFWTPFTIFGGLFVAISTAAIHYYYGHQLDGRFVDESIPQSWNTALSVAFAHVFATALATSVSTSYTQLLWWFLRRRSLSVSRIDALFSLNSSALNLYRLSLLKTTPALWFCGLLIPLISIATIFPPGSLVVQQLPYTYDRPTYVSTIDVKYRGDGSALDFFDKSMWQNDLNGSYLAPDKRYLAIGRRTIREGQYDTTSSPCGNNCTYELKFPAPSLDCEDDTPNDGLEKLVMKYYNKTSSVEFNKTTTWDPSQAQYMAATGQEGKPGNQIWTFSISYRANDSKVLKNGLRNVSCTVVNAMYTAHIKHTNSTQTVSVEVQKEEPLNATALSEDYIFSDVVNSGPTAKDFTKTESPEHNFTMGDIDARYHGMQLRAMSDTFMRPLQGAISGYGTNNYFSVNTIIEDTPFAHQKYNKTSYTYTDVTFDLSASVVEQLFHNITISIMNRKRNRIIAITTTTTYESAYVFRSPIRLLVAYGGALAVCFAFCMSGCVVLYKNGASASSGGFLQIMCTTQHADGIMNQLAKQASLSGKEGVSRELSRLKVRFGLVTDEKTERKHGAFGTVEETEVLLKAY